jgi:hypothetical protein
MLPALLLVAVGGRRRVWIPLPAFLLWPVWLLGWVVWLALRLLRVPWERPLRAALALAAGLSGLRVDIDTSGGEHIHLRAI